MIIEGTISIYIIQQHKNSFSSKCSYNKYIKNSSLFSFKIVYIFIKMCIYNNYFYDLLC